MVVVASQAKGATWTKRTVVGVEEDILTNSHDTDFIEERVGRATIDNKRRVGCETIFLVTLSKSIRLFLIRGDERIITLGRTAIKPGERGNTERMNESKRERERKRERDRDRETERQRKRETEKKRDREKER